MANTKNLTYYAGTSALACTMTSLASGSTRESAQYYNSTGSNLGGQIAVTFTLASGSPSTTGPAVNVYAVGSVDGTVWPILQTLAGGTYTTGAGDGAAGALGSPPNVSMIGSFGLATVTSSGERTFRTRPLSLLAAFPDGLPLAFSILVENQSGIAFSASTAAAAQEVRVQPLATTSGN